MQDGFVPPTEFKAGYISDYEQGAREEPVEIFNPSPKPPKEQPTPPRKALKSNASPNRQLATLCVAKKSSSHLAPPANREA